ncbi:ABC transporter substrate-binding protein [Pseudoalteromonas fenneropenaei]|uniref:Thiamine pyrimidine synthase n=1 Tax=Pseudoalteromonas fenneropenaei TaxID=1737459 RepID=A0ABV7CJY3_9GAMM
MCFPLLAHSKVLDSVSLQLKWTHQFQFAGYYVAKQKGFYEQAGLNVNIIPADPNNPDTFFNVLSGRAHFGITHSGVLQQRLAGKPVVAMAAILQSSPYCWMVNAGSDIKAPKDFAGKRIPHISRSENAELVAMLERSGVSIDEMRLYAGLHPMEDFQRGLFDALQVYITNEPFVMKQLGVEVRLICPKRYGLNVYSDILYTSEQMVRYRPDVVQRFKEASLRGWRYALLNMEEAIAITHEHYATAKSVEQLAYEAEKLKSYISVPGVSLGNMTLSKWEWIADLYQLDKQQFREHSRGFLFSDSQAQLPSWSWMLVAACILTLLAIPMYLHLMFSKRRKLQLQRRNEEP